jgi:hypothetical protein
MAHTVSSSLNALDKILEERVVSRGLWPLPSPIADPQPCLSLNFIMLCRV